ncbi:MAG: TauD/TfdA family dioxygenase [Actinomycetota bacterium]|nr:TauD/TfdA family dioxygenase [Actinomycetota bacterium]MEE3256956.1 TauD/TfdA family dioxygenase [Actinomycetota bacterium]
MSDMTIVPMANKAFGATATGVDLKNLSDEDFSELRAAFLEHGFLLFPDQHLNEEDSIAFGERFGDLEFGGAPMANQKKHEDGSFGKIYDLQSQLMRTNVGNETWHTDSTYKPISSKVAMLSAVVVPDEGGQTELADLRSGYETLDDATKEMVAGLSAFHSTNFSQANDLGDFPDTNGDGLYGEVYHGEAYLRPMVKIHPETGKPNLFVGRHAFGIPGLGRDESRKLIRSLIDHVVSDDSRVYSHNWVVGDTLLWDNRRALHRARPYDYTKPRYLIGTRVAGDPASELAYYPEDPEAEAGRKALIEELGILREETKDRMYGATTASF